MPHVTAAGQKVYVLPTCSVQQGSAKAEKVLLESSLVSLQAIQQAVGADSPQSKAATKITMKLVQIVESLLSDAYDSRYAIHLNLRFSSLCCCCSKVPKWLSLCCEISDVLTFHC